MGPGRITRRRGTCALHLGQSHADLRVVFIGLRKGPEKGNHAVPFTPNDSQRLMS